MQRSLVLVRAHRHAWRTLEAFWGERCAEDTVGIDVDVDRIADREGCAATAGELLA